MDYLTVLGRFHGATLVHVSDFSCCDESLVGIPRMFSKAEDIMIHPLNLQHSLEGFVVTKTGAKSANRSPVIFFQ